jgi:hypothetical protein
MSSRLSSVALSAPILFLSGGASRIIMKLGGSLTEPLPAMLMHVLLTLRNFRRLVCTSFTRSCPTAPAVMFVIAHIIMHLHKPVAVSLLLDLIAFHHSLRIRSQHSPATPYFTISHILAESDKIFKLLCTCRGGIQIGDAPTQPNATEH